MKTHPHIAQAGHAASGKTETVRAWLWAEWNRENPDKQITWQKFMESFEIPSPDNTESNPK